MSNFTLIDFIEESNGIEGIYRSPTSTEIEAHKKLLKVKQIKVQHTGDICQ